MRQLFLVAATAALFIMSSQSSWAASCAMKAEKDALDMRALQTHLMVASLSCGEQQRYNQFISQFKDEISESNQALSTYFQRVHAGRAEKKKNDFVTKLANVSSELSLEESLDDICDDLADVFDDAFESDADEIVHLARLEEVDELHGVSQCR